MPNPLRRYRVTYVVYAGVDNHETVVGTGRVTVAAITAADAVRKACAWAYDHDPRCDERIDPCVQITRVRRIRVAAPTEG